MRTKSTPEYAEVTADFKPLPKHGHLSKKMPEYAAAEDQIRAGYTPIWGAPDFPSMRAVAGNADAPMPPGGPDRYRDVVTELIQFPVRDGTLIELKVYKSPNVVDDATLMYRMHGGGMVVGSHEVDGAENVYAATNPNIVVVSVDYRLAPEHPFPIPFQDSYDGLLWCKENAKTLGANPEKIILSGSSAGGSLAATVAVQARDDGLTGIVAQVLHFPLTCHPKFFPRDKYEFGSYIQNSENPVLSSVIYELTLDAHAPNAEHDWRHSPLLAKSHAGLPPALIQCAGGDILRDDAFAYAEALKADGVEVELHAYAGVPHCFPVILTQIPQVADFYERYTKFLERYAK
ncbi:Alpha/Beta hydrolase protein [Fusarium solani]|uniref:Alpha/Beta hydrolase protein n=1 Tax=Fusarium solani TaxID=169388 RepID=A0A9P9GYP4_FUSSL|nr:Alpha/Beta hydrolase protein [Fusarium solani]KAH7247855.1 Alpha/Beta hydrolase protein [Fusarium solani]